MQLRATLFTFVGVLATSAPANAQLNLRRTEVLQGSYRTIGNLLIDCPGAGSGTCDNNTAIMVAVDVDQDPTTAMSSSADLDLPAGAVVRSATLYLSGQAYIDAPGSAGPVWIPADLVDYPVKLSGPGGGYTTVLPVEVQSILTYVGYLARYDVTHLVSTGGTYFVADALLAPASHAYNRILSWTLLVTYEDGSPPFLVNTYDGVLNCFSNTTILNLSGFRTPSATAPTALMSAWSVDGHAQFAGESIRVGTLLASNAQNPSNNIGNSSVSGPNGNITRTPSTFRVTEEMDLDTFVVSGAFSPGQTDVDVTFTCGTQEGVVYHLAVLGVDIIAPQLSVTKTVIDLNGGEAVAGDELRYELRARNNGGDDAVQVVLRDPLPAGLAYVPGSIEYGELTAVPKTDQAGDDEAEWSGGALTFRLGTNANATTGGTLAVGLEEVVHFRAIIETTTAARQLINRAYLSATGAQGGSGSTLIEVQSSTVGVAALPCEGFSNGQCPDAGFPEDAAAPADVGFPEDATAPNDAGIEDDASLADVGAPQPDVGTPPDTGARDSGVTPVDAAVGVDTGTMDTKSDEGCGCNNTGDPGRGAGTHLLLGLLFTAGWATRRRR
ncbi:MAG: DUF11 domain-containing protein [Deltaproteobacteria bacterium]|nr:DUF11 domain-containing protein [Deltaproteobacteria bacterium]